MLIKCNKPPELLFLRIFLAKKYITYKNRRKILQREFNRTMPIKIALVNVLRFPFVHAPCYITTNVQPLIELSVATNKIIIYDMI